MSNPNPTSPLNPDLQPASKSRSQVTIRAMVILVLVISAYFAGVNHRIWPEPPPLPHQAQDSELERDPLLSNLPTAVVEAYQRRFRNHRVWSAVQTNYKGAEVYDLEVFDPNGAVSKHYGVGEKTVSQLLSTHLVVQEDGIVIREDRHSISATLVPARARQAFQRWSQRFPSRGDPFVYWHVHQNEGRPRVYRARVELNSIEFYEAEMNSGGKILSQASHFENQKS